MLIWCFTVSTYFSSPQLSQDLAYSGWSPPQFTRKLTVVIRILLTTFPVHFKTSTIVFTVAIFLAFVTSQWIVYVLFHPLRCIASFFWWGYYKGVKIHYICIRLCCSPFFLNRYSFHFSHILLFYRCFFISSMVHRESSLLPTTPLLTFGYLWG